MKKRNKRHPIHATEPSKKFIKLQNGPLDSFILGMIPYDICCGQHSGFPECCIKFWVIKWTWATYIDSKFANDYRKKLNKYHPGYIACPKCLRAKNFVDVQPCPKSCRLKCFVLGRNWWKKS